MLRPDEIKAEEVSALSECDVCGEEHETNDCPQLQNGKQIENARAPSRARLTLPSNLRIKKLTDGAFTIVVRENISSGTRFGPYEAQVVYDSAPQTPFPLKIFNKNGESYYLDSSNEEECNWMFFVLAAQTQNEQNLMAYQLGPDIYFSALRTIRIHEELKVWYAPHYAKKMAMEPPWKPDDPEQLKISTPIPKKVVHKIRVEESQEPSKKRGRKRKIYKDFVDTPDDDTNAQVLEKMVCSSPSSPTATAEAAQHDIPIEVSRKRGRKKRIYKDFVETPDLDGQDDVAELIPKSEPPNTVSLKPLTVNVSQCEWPCSQCSQIFGSCSEFARHLRQHYCPRKSGQDKKPSGVVQARPKNFLCQFCDTRFSSSKLLQRHCLRLHRRQTRGMKSLGAIPNVDNNSESKLQDPIADNQCNEKNKVEVTKSERKPRHISDKDAASILLEIEANADKPEEGLFENCSHTEPVESMPVIVMASTLQSSDVQDNQFNYGAETEYAAMGICEPNEMEPGKDAPMEEHIAPGNTMLEEVTLHTVRDLADGSVYSLNDVSLVGKEEATRYSCDICKKTFDKIQYLYKHIGIHTGEFSCTTCKKGFSRKESLLKHNCTEATRTDGGNSDEESNKEYFCSFCQKSFAKKQLLRRHITKHTGEFTCQECGKSYCSKNILKSHICSKNPEERGSYSCGICHKTFSKESYLEKHIPIHTGAHTCPNCGKWLRSSNSLNNHIRICYQVKALETNGSAACPHCKQVFTDAQSFRRHMYDHTHLFMCINCGARFRNKVSEMQHLCQAQRIVQCNICEEKFPNVAVLNKHKASHGEEQIKCISCGKTFHQKDELSTHQCQEKNAKKKSKKRSRKPPSLQPLICEVCGSLFSSTSSLNVHKRLHGEKLFSCELCGKQFHRKDLMLDHCAVHGEAAIPCLMCDKMFKTKKSLDVHMLIHDGIKRFACSICGKQFYQKGNLLKHEEVHNPERKHPCTFCSKMFSTKEYLAIHVLEHTLGRIHACDMCDKSFVKEHQLKAHQRVFHTNFSYICSFCGLSVKLKHSLKRHLNKKHPDQRCHWNGDDQIAAMLVNNVDGEEEEMGNNGESMQLIETSNQVQDGTEVLLAVAGIGSEALQQALASGTARIQQGATPNTIEISLPADNEMEDNAFISSMLDGGNDMQTHQIIHLPMAGELEGNSVGETVDVIEQTNVENTSNAETMETQITVLSGEEQFQSAALTGNETIMLDNGTILQPGVSQDGRSLLFYLVSTNEPGCGNDEAPS